MNVRGRRQCFCLYLCLCLIVDATVSYECEKIRFVYLCYCVSVLVYDKLLDLACDVLI